jgi:DNA-binding NarL/FixJ family response regulator
VINLLIADDSRMARRGFSDLLDLSAGAAPLPPVNLQGRVLLRKRQVDVVKLVVDGNTIEDVAEILGLTEHTVSNYLSRIYEQLDVSNLSKLVRYSLRRQG